MKLSVVIVNYNVKYFLEQCLKSVQKALKGIDGEIWVVDNNSVDGSVEMLREKFTEVHLIANGQNTGFSKANNLAILKSKGEYVLLLNPDTVIEEDSLQKCIRFMDEHPDAGALGVRMLDGAGNFLPESKRGLPTPEVALYKMFGLNKLFPRSKKFGRYHLGFLSEFKTAEVEVLAGAFMFLRKKTLDQIGLLDESFFMYGEDIDLSYRILKASYKNYYFPETSIIHYKGESTKKGSANYVKIFYQAMVIFARKHYSGTKSRFLIFLINSFIYVRALAALIYRWFSKWWLPMLDATLLFVGMYFLKSYWEEHIKYLKSYPIELMTIHVPYYVFLWIGVTHINMGYEKPFLLKRIVRGVAIGTILILAVYGLFPENLRFSRGLIILGAIWAIIEMIITRFIANYFINGRFSLGNDLNAKVVIIGSMQEGQRVQNLISRSGNYDSIIGIVGTGKDQHEGNYIGYLENLEEIVRIFKIEEIIFCSKDLSAKSILEWMVKLGSRKLHFKIAPEASSFIIGSHSKNSNGEFFTEEIVLKLSTLSAKKKKRLFDLFSGWILLITFPIWILFVKNAVLKAKFCIEVIRNQKTWVGYAGTGEQVLLPKLKEGVYNTGLVSGKTISDAEMLNKLNNRYAQFYSIEMDIEILWANFF